MIGNSACHFNPVDPSPPNFLESHSWVLKILPFSRSTLSLRWVTSAMMSLPTTPHWVLECHRQCPLAYGHDLKWRADSCPHTAFSPTSTKSTCNQAQRLHVISRVSIAQAPDPICGNEKSSQQQFLPLLSYCSRLEMGYKTLPPHHYRSL